ncbi:hypothetical protein GW17_00053391 [Ensete ventricosum]|nr:hypothetical protein GW17_00053391 [Ensete ventricosum]
MALPHLPWSWAELGPTSPRQGPRPFTTGPECSFRNVLPSPWPSLDSDASFGVADTSAGRPLFLVGMGRQSCCYKQKLRKGLWSPEEDEKLMRHITKYGHGCWSSVPKQAGNACRHCQFNQNMPSPLPLVLRCAILSGLERCGKSCRLRWINYLRPDLKRGTFSEQEQSLIIELHAVLGNR